MTVARLEAEMSSIELSEWYAFVGIEPLPDHYLIGAQICATNIAGAGGTARVEDYIPKPEPRSGPVRLTAEQTAGMLGRLMNRV